MKPVRLTKKELDRADTSLPGLPFTIVVRQQCANSYWVAAINITTGLPLFPALGQTFVQSKSDIPSAVVAIGRDLHKHAGVQTRMTAGMRHGHEEKNDGD